MDRVLHGARDENFGPHERLRTSGVKGEGVCIAPTMAQPGPCRKVAASLGRGAGSGSSKICSSPLQQPVRLGARFRCYLGAGEHTRDFLLPARFVEQRDGGAGDCPLGGFGDQIVRAPPRGDLRRMSDSQQLPAFRQPREALADGTGHRPAHAAIDLVEDDRPALPARP
jgi:hypothetical protein